MATRATMKDKFTSRSSGQARSVYLEAKTKNQSASPTGAIWGCSKGFIALSKHRSLVPSAGAWVTVISAWSPR